MGSDALFAGDRESTGIDWGWATGGQRRIAQARRQRPVHPRRMSDESDYGTSSVGFRNAASTTGESLAAARNRSAPC